MPGRAAIQSAVLSGMRRSWRPFATCSPTYRVPEGAGIANLPVGALRVLVSSHDVRIHCGKRPCLADDSTELGQSRLCFCDVKIIAKGVEPWTGMCSFIGSIELTMRGGTKNARAREPRQILPLANPRPTLRTLLKTLLSSTCTESLTVL